MNKKITLKEALKLVRFHYVKGGCTMNFTNQELGLLVDAISWELEMFEVWTDSPRHAMLRDLQERIQETINEAND